MFGSPALIHRKPYPAPVENMVSKVFDLCVGPLCAARFLKAVFITNAPAQTPGSLVSHYSGPFTIPRPAGSLQNRRNPIRCYGCAGKKSDRWFAAACRRKRRQDLLSIRSPRKSQNMTIRKVVCRSPVFTFLRGRHHQNISSL